MSNVFFETNDFLEKMIKDYYKFCTSFVLMTYDGEF